MHINKLNCNSNQLTFQQFLRIPNISSRISTYLSFSVISINPQLDFLLFFSTIEGIDGPLGTKEKIFHSVVD